jgi:hypothetical protein
MPLIQSFLEWAYTSFEQSVTEFHTTHLEGHLQVALQILEAGICSSLLSTKLTTVVHCSNVMTVPAMEATEIHLRTLQTISEYFQLCEWQHCHIGKTASLFRKVSLAVIWP